MLVSLEEKLAVDLIGNNHPAVADDNLPHAGDFFFCPDPADGVMRVAEDDRLDAVGTRLHADVGGKFSLQGRHSP